MQQALEQELPESKVATPSLIKVASSYAVLHPMHLSDHINRNLIKLTFFIYRRSSVNEFYAYIYF
jgi:hypothetical protein